MRLSSRGCARARARVRVVYSANAVTATYLSRCKLNSVKFSGRGGESAWEKKVGTVELRFLKSELGERLLLSGESE